MTLSIEGLDASEDTPHRLLEELRSQEVTSAFRLRWIEPITWDEGRRILLVNCAATYEDLGIFEERAVAAVARAARAVFPAREPTVRVLDMAVVLPPQADDAVAERWGFYSVVLQLTADFLRQDPQAAKYVAEQLQQMKRFRRASFACDELAALGIFSVELEARSSAAAAGGARDALIGLMYAAVKDPRPYSITTLKARVAIRLTPAPSAATIM